MHWIVEITSLAKPDDRAQNVNVEAPSWEEAVKLVRKYTGLPQTISGFSIEIRTDGLCAVDPQQHIRYRLQQRESSAESPLSQRKPIEPSPAKAKPVKSVAAIRRPSSDPPLSAQRNKTPPQGFAAVSAPSGVSGTTNNTHDARDVLPTAMGSTAADMRSTIPDRPRRVIVATEEPVPLTRKSKQVQQPESTSAPAAATPPLAQPTAASALLQPQPPASHQTLSVPLQATVGASAPEVVELMRREEDPTDTSPMTYREYAYAITPTCTDQEATRFITNQFNQIRLALANVKTPKMVNLAVFDHVFSQRPERPPQVTLTWKDWKGEAELQYPARDTQSATTRGDQGGERNEQGAPAPSGPTPNAALTADDKPRTDATMEPLPLLSDNAKMQARLRAKSSPQASAPIHESPPSSHSVSQPIAQPVSQLIAQPIAKDSPTQHAVLLRADSPADEEILVDVFEAMHDLYFYRDAYEAADFIVNLAIETMNCDVGLAQLYDINRQEYVVVHAVGPSAQQVLGHRTSERDIIVQQIISCKDRPIVIDTPDAFSRSQRWQKLGLIPSSVLARVVVHSDRILAILELGHETPKQSFRNIDGNMLEYMANSYAEFIIKTGALFGHSSS